MKTRTDTEILLELLHSLQELDTYSAKEAIIHFENMIQSAVEEVGRDRLTEWYRQKVGPEKYDKMLEDIRRDLEKQ